MRLGCRSAFRRTLCTLTTLITLPIWFLASAMPLHAQAVEFPIGVGTGSKEAQVTQDGKQWAALATSSIPIYGGAIIRTGNGAASVLLRDGAQLELRPGSVIEIAGDRIAPTIKIAVGQLLFRLPASSQTVLITPSVRYQGMASPGTDTPPSIRVAADSPRSSDRIGEIVVTQRGASRIGLRQGEMLAKSVSHPGLHIVKAGQSVSIQQVGASDPSFRALLAQALPGGASALPDSDAVPVYDASGRSLGYIGIDGSFVPSPGITPNLPTPVPAGTIPSNVTLPAGTTPIFTAEPAYVGYLLGEKFAAAIPFDGAAPIAGAGAGSGGTYGTGLAITGLALAGAVTGGYFASQGEKPASPSGFGL